MGHRDPQAYRDFACIARRIVDQVCLASIDVTCTRARSVLVSFHGEVQVMLLRVLSRSLNRSASVSEPR